MDRSTGTPVGFVLLVLLAIAMGWVLLGRDDHGGTLLSSFPAETPSSAGSAQLDAAAAQPALVWPDDMPGPMTAYVGRRVSAFGLRVTSVDADEGFWVEKEGRTAWVQLETPTESPYTVRAGDVVSLSGQVLPHDGHWPSQLYFCPDRGASAARLAQEPTHLAVRVDALSFGVG